MVNPISGQPQSVDWAPRLGKKEKVGWLGWRPLLPGYRCHVTSSLTPAAASPLLQPHPHCSLDLLQPHPCCHAYLA